MVQEENIFSRIHPQRISLLIENQIKQAIFENHYRVGEKIPSERALAELFDSSRSSVREALRTLERSRLIVIRKGVQGGAYVTNNISKHIVESMNDLFEFGQVSLEQILKARLIIEPSVAAEAAKNATPEDIESLKEANQTLREGYKTGDPAKENIPIIHRVIARIGGNKVIRMIMDVLMDVHTIRMSNIKLGDKANKQILDMHERIIEAIMKKDDKKTFNLMKKHILQAHEIHERIEEQAE